MNPVELVAFIKPYPGGGDEWWAWDDRCGRMAKVAVGYFWLHIEDCRDKHYQTPKKYAADTSAMLAALAVPGCDHRFDTNQTCTICGKKEKL